MQVQLPTVLLAHLNLLRLLPPMVPCKYQRSNGCVLEKENALESSGGANNYDDKDPRMNNIATLYTLKSFLEQWLAWPLGGAFV